MKILHTSDWHLGRSLFGRKRYHEFEGFLDWLLQTIEEQRVDLLVVAGDIFDTSTPPNRAQELYYAFLCKVSRSCCQHVIIIGGNHDSPSFLNAPRDLLRAMNVVVIGAMMDRPEDEVIVLHDRQDRPQAIVCAVPYLRDREIRLVEPGETIDEKNAKLVEGLTRHYAEVCAAAARKRGELGHDLPVIATGHLFTAGGRTVEGDGVRELYVGSLVHVEDSAFPPEIDYLALGHLHQAQTVGKKEHVRYSGSPLPMGFGEASQQKKVVLASFDGRQPVIEELAIPCFQELERIRGNLDALHARIGELKAAGSRAWLEVEYNGRDMVNDLRELLDEVVAGSGLEILRIKNARMIERMIGQVEEETLDDLAPGDVFARCLEAFEVPAEDQEELKNLHDEVIRSLEEEDLNAE